MFGFGKKPTPEAPSPQDTGDKQPSALGKLGLFAHKDKPQEAAPAETPDLPAATALEAGPIAPATTPATAPAEFTQPGTDVTENTPGQTDGVDAPLEAPETTSFDAASATADEPTVETLPPPETAETPATTEPTTDANPDTIAPVATGLAPETSESVELVPEVSSADVEDTEKALKAFQETLGNAPVESPDATLVQETSQEIPSAPAATESLAAPDLQESSPTSSDSTEANQPIIKERSALPSVAPKREELPPVDQAERPEATTPVPPPRSEVVVPERETDEKPAA